MLTAARVEITETTANVTIVCRMLNPSALKCARHGFASLGVCFCTIIFLLCVRTFSVLVRSPGRPAFYNHRAKGNLIQNAGLLGRYPYLLPEFVTECDRLWKC